jgi:hypothetical protein
MGFSLSCKTKKRIAMSHKFLLDVKFHLFLITIDQEFAEKVRQQGCLHCGNKLHRDNYPRSPFGLPQALREYYEQRISFCCSDCRKRTTPPSVRFFGRRWFAAPILIFISALMLGINERRLMQIKQHFGITVSEATWKRWRKWWRDVFIETPFWQQAKGLVPPDIETTKPFPYALLSVSRGNLKERIVSLLQFLSPLTGGVLRAV